MARVRRDNDQRYLLREELAELDSTDLPSLSTEDPRIQDGQISNWDYTAGVVTTNSANWDTAFSWGNHATANYLLTTAENEHAADTWGLRLETTGFDNPSGFYAIGNDFTMIVRNSSGAIGARLDADATEANNHIGGNPIWHKGNLTTTEKANWNTAFGWGNHASAGYSAQVGGPYYNYLSTSTAAVGTTSPNVRFGRSSSQYMTFHGYAGGNVLTSVSGAGNPKSNMYFGVSQDGGLTSSATWTLGGASGSIWHSGNFTDNSTNWNSAYSDTSAATDAATASTIVKRNSNADINCRLVRPNYTDQASISGAMAFRVNNGSDNYIRFCNDKAAIRTYLNAPTRTGGDASGTWGISITGNAATATWADQVDVNASDTGGGNYSLVWHSGDQLFRSSQMYYNRDAQRLTVPNITATLSGSSTSCTGNAATATWADTVDVNSGQSSQNQWYDVVWHSGDTVYSTPTVRIYPSIGAMDADRYYIGNAYLDAPAGNYGSMNITGAVGSSGTYSGYAINDRVVFMNNNSTTSGLYNDTNNEWFIRFVENSGTYLYYNGVQTFSTAGHGVSGVWNNNGAPNASSQIRKLTQAQYDAISTKDANTLYIIVG